MAAILGKQRAISIQHGRTRREETDTGTGNNKGCQSFTIILVYSISVLFFGDVLFTHLVVVVDLPGHFWCFSFNDVEFQTSIGTLMYFGSLLFLEWVCLSCLECPRELNWTVNYEVE